ncbi:dioxygenase family protein [Bradyrhizobium sp. AZCC 1693]|uniref:dioxygenase family protein n=1 Tax=Bradyrhizobium sp. AZCC 1693 TaxID=3117029 RepID=UPI002FF0E52E
MIDTPTRRVVLGAGVFAAGSLFMVDGSVAQAPLAPTPACHDGDDATVPQTEGPYFKPSSPERTELFEEGMAGQPIELVGFVLTRACKPLAGALLDFWQADDKGRYDNSGFRLRGPPVLRCGRTLSIAQHRARHLSRPYAPYPCEGAAA